MALTTGSVSPLLTEGIRKLVGDTFRRYPLEFSAYLNMLTTRKNFEDDREVTTLGALSSKAENAPIVLSDPVVGRNKRYQTSTFAGGVRVSWEAEADELYGFINRAFSSLGKAANETMNIEGAGVWNNAAASSPTAEFTGFDTLALLHNTHTGPLGGAISYADNLLAADLSESVLQTALTQFEDVRDAQDNRMMMNPNKLLIHRDNMFLAREILKSQGKPFTGDNTTNVLNDILQIVILHYGTDSDQWIIQDSDHDANFFMRTAPVMDAYDDKSTKSMVSTLATRFSKGFGDWRSFIGSAGV